MIPRGIFGWLVLAFCSGQFFLLGFTWWRMIAGGTADTRSGVAAGLGAVAFVALVYAVAPRLIRWFLRRSGRR
jgi:hypothetical protein